MRIGRNEIVEELTEHIRKCGGEPGEWFVGTAATVAKLPVADSSGNPKLPGLAYREAHTPYAAAETVDYLISAFGLQPARDARPGHVVFVHRPTKDNPESEAWGPKSETQAEIVVGR